MAGKTKRFSFVCGPDDYLVGRAGKERFEAMVGEAGADDFSREILSGFAANVGEVETAVNRFRESVQTVPMFGGKRVVWLKDVNFLADSVTGRAEGTLSQVEDLQALLAVVNPEEVSVLITASPIDRRRSFPKWCEQNADFLLVGGDGDGATEALARVIAEEAQSVGSRFGPGAAELLLAKIGPNTRLLVEEVRKLASYAGEGAAIEEAHVEELSPNVAEGDFFETAEAFFSGDLRFTLDALHRHFYSGGDARPILSALQNRNRILIQVRALIDSGEARLGQRGLDGLQRATATFGKRFGEALGEKSSFNVFSQNAWYVGKLAQAGKLPSLRRLIDNQREFVVAFESLIGRSGEEEEVLREMIVRCLGAENRA
ncbi:MAG: DNA polymerase III subunit delta [Opitutaceae bacterium]|jgi:DNA polymerase-3 subunit delta